MFLTFQRPLLPLLLLHFLTVLIHCHQSDMDSARDFSFEVEDSPLHGRLLEYPAVHSVDQRQGPRQSHS